MSGMCAISGRAPLGNVLVVAINSDRSVGR
jgi:hypothetical protein